MNTASSGHRGVSPALCIPDMVKCVAERTPTAIALTAPGRTPLTYARLHRHLQDVQNALNAIGVGQNDRLAVVLPGGPEMAVAFVAIAAAATFAPLNPSSRPSEFDASLRALDPKGLVVQSGGDSPAVAVARGRGIPIIELVPGVSAEAGIFALAGPARPRSPNPGRAEPADTALVLSTSGTTAQPKLVPLTHANICASAWNIATNLALTGNDRCLGVMPLYHIHGLIGATLSTLAGGAGMACLPAFDENAFFASLETVRPSWYTGTPTLHRAILACAAKHAEVIRRHPLRFIRSCSAPLPPEVAGELERVFEAPVIEAYGMTEASHEICSNPLPPKPRNVRSVGVPTACEVAIMDEGGNLLPPRTTGEIVIRGPNVFAGYDGDPEATATAFTHGWLRTGDQGSIDRDGYVYIEGRLKDIINRGGTKVSPREIEDVLSDHPAIAQAVVFAIPHSTLGEAIAAAVVLRADANTTERDLREFVATRVTDSRVPSQVLIVDEIPNGGFGKLQRAKLAEAFAPVLKSPLVRPSGPIESALADIWADVLGVPEVGARDNFFAGGGDSLLAGRLLVRVHDRFHVAVSLRAFFAAPTVADLATAVVQELAEHAMAGAVARTLEGVLEFSDADPRRLLIDTGG